MSVKSTAKRIRAIFIALAITVVANYAISYAARANNTASDVVISQSMSGQRSGQTAPTDKPATPKP